MSENTLSTKESSSFSSKFNKQMNYYGKDFKSCVLLGAVGISAFLTFASLILLLGYIFIMGLGNLNPSLFAWEYNSTNVSLKIGRAHV